MVSSGDPDPHNVFHDGWMLEEMINWGAVVRKESPLQEELGSKGRRRVSERSKGPKPPVPGVQEDDTDEVFLATSLNEKQKALKLIEHMRKMVASRVVNPHDLDETKEDPRLVCILDKLGECENTLMEKDRLSLVLLGRNGVGKLFLIK